MNRFGGALRYPLLFVTGLAISGCSYLPFGDGFFTKQEDAVVDIYPIEPELAVTGEATPEPTIVPEIVQPKPRWKPANIPVAPARTEIIGEADPVEDIESISGEDTPNVEQILGMSFSEVREKLGQPIWIRDVYPARVWGYDRKSCSLQIFFYLKLDQDGDYRVLAFESGAQSEAGDNIESSQGDNQSPGEDAAIINPGEISESDQKLAQACFHKLIEDSTSAKEAISKNTIPES